MLRVAGHDHCSFGNHGAVADAAPESESRGEGYWLGVWLCGARVTMDAAHRPWMRLACHGPCRGGRAARDGAATNGRGLDLRGAVAWDEADCGELAPPWALRRHLCEIGERDEYERV